jgi:hypothetical protein
MLPPNPAQDIIQEEDKKPEDVVQDLTVENAKLADENARIYQDLIQAQECASKWEESYHVEREKKTQPDSREWKRLYNDAYDETISLRAESAQMRAQDLKNATIRARHERKADVENANKMTEMQTKLDKWNRKVGQLENHNESLKRQLYDQTQAIKNVETMKAANAKTYDEQYETITTLKSEKNRSNLRIRELEHKLSTLETPQDAAKVAAVKAATTKLNKEHSISILKLEQRHGKKMAGAKRFLAKSGLVTRIQSGAVAKPNSSVTIVAEDSQKAAVQTESLSSITEEQSHKDEIAANSTKTVSDIQEEKETSPVAKPNSSVDIVAEGSEKAVVQTEALPDVTGEQSYHDQIVADSFKALSDLIRIHGKKETNPVAKPNSSVDIVAESSTKAAVQTNTLPDVTEEQPHKDETTADSGKEKNTVSEPNSSVDIVAEDSKKAAVQTNALPDGTEEQSHKDEIANSTKALSDLERIREEKEQIAADLTKASSDLNRVEGEKAKIAADLTKALSDLNRVQEEKAKIAADLTKASSDLSQAQLEKDKIAANSSSFSSDLDKTAADLTKAETDLSQAQSEKENMTANFTKASSDLNNVQSEKENAKADLQRTRAELQTKSALAERLQQENQTLRSRVPDHTQCHQQLQIHEADTREALRQRNEASSTLRESNNAHENTKAQLGSINRELLTLREIHNQCNQATQPLDKMDVVDAADEFTEADDMDVDAPQQVLVDRLELAQQANEELRLQNAKLVEVMQGSGDRGDDLESSSSGAGEMRIREKVLDEVKEERGALLRRIDDQNDEIARKNEALKTNNVSQRLQDELKAAKEKASKLEYDLSTLRTVMTKPSGASTPTQARIGQTGPSSPGSSANDVIQKLKFDAKRLTKEAKEAKANYERVDKVLFGRDQKACEDLRNVEKVKGEMGAEVERLQKKIERLEAGVREEAPPPASDSSAPVLSDSAKGKRAWVGDGDDEAGREAAKKLRA